MKNTIVINHIAIKPNSWILFPSELNRDDQQGFNKDENAAKENTLLLIIVK